MSEIKIALTGKLRSGKSTAARHLIAQGFTPLSFGGDLTKYATELFEHSRVYPPISISKPDPFGGEMVTAYKKDRRLLQDFGEKMREIDPHIWIDRLAAKLEREELRALSEGRPLRIVIDDLRQPLEYEWARANGFTLVRISANENTRIERAKEAGDDFSVGDLRHTTEMYVDDFEADYDIWNDGVEQAELERKIDELMSEIKSRRESVI